MRRIDVEEAAAIGAELLDRDLGSGRPERNGLLGCRHLFGDRIALVVLERLTVGSVLRSVVGHRLHQRRRRVLVERLRHALRHQHECEHDRQRKQDVDGGANEIGPEVADAARLLADEAANQRDEHGHPGRSGDEVLHGEREHLREIAHRGLAAVPLPVRVGREARRRVERRVRAHRGHVLRIEREPWLQPLQSVDDQRSGQVEPEHRQRVFDPAHVARRVHAGAAVDQTLERAADALGPDCTAFVHRGHVRTERLRQQQEHDDIESELQPAVGGHEKNSGLNSAMIR